MPAIGENNILSIVRDSPNGLYLDGGQYGEILLPKRYVTDVVGIGEELEVFLYRDSEDRLVATTEKPYAFVDEFACLKVAGYKPNVGAFLDMGLSKDLLLPLAEQKGHVAPGDRVVVYITLDEHTDRLVASMRVDRFLSKAKPRYQEGQAVKVLVYAESDLGYNVIVENAHRGLLYHTALNARLSIGQELTAYIQSIRPDGKIDLKLDQAGYSRISPLAEQIIEKLTASESGRLDLSDESPPEAIRYAFGVSKKAFKQAVGMLLKQGRISIGDGSLWLCKQK